MVFIPEQNLANLKKHKYNSTGYSYLDLVLNKLIWEPIVQFLPRSLAPNLITVIGLTFMVLGYLLMAYYDTTFDKQPPAWVVFFGAFCNFAYQTLDAIDGKQARRIGLSSPLGMLMDHGCDSISATILFLTLMQGLALGVNSYTFIMMATIHIAFFLAMWEEYHTHFARTHMFSWGVTEGQWTTIALLVIGGVFTSEVYNTKVFGYTWVTVLVSLNSAWGLAVSILMILNTSSKVAGIQPYLRLIPIILLSISLYFWFENRLTEIYGPIVFIVHGLDFAGICSKAIICSTAILNFGWFQSEVFIEFLYLIENRYIKFLPENVTFFIVSLYLVLNYCNFVVTIVNQLTKFLKISVFRVT